MRKYTLQSENGLSISLEATSDRKAKHRASTEILPHNHFIEAHLISDTGDRWMKVYRGIGDDGRFLYSRWEREE